MPAFIRTQKDEATWEKAKQAANKSHSESEGDSYWAVVNHIYQKMKKSDSAVEELISSLKKARRKMSDEYDPYDEDGSEDDLGEGFSEFNPDDESAGEDWLKENDPGYGRDKYEEYNHDEDEDAHRQSIEEDLGNVGEVEEPGQEIPATAATGQAVSTPQSSSPTEEVGEKQGRFRQPSREELIAMRNYTRPWEQRIRETQKLQADPSKNPVLAQQGNIIEARNKWHKDRQSAYQQLVNGDEYKNADPITQMEMDDNFEKEWHGKNPDHLIGAMQAHHEAHGKGKEAKELHAAAKDAKIRNVLEGGASPEEVFSTEEGLQHAGGAKGEEGTVGTIVQDPAAQFAMGNQEFVRQFAQEYGKRAKQPEGEVDEYAEGPKRDINRILGDAPAKDPKFEAFFSHYYPLILMSAKRVRNQLGLDPNHPDKDIHEGLMHEAGMHGLAQAMNDYDHDNPSKASFATHAGNKIRGLQMTAMRNIDQIPAELRQAQKKFAAQQAAPKSSVHDVIKQSKHPAANDMADRLKRVGTQREVQQAKVVRRPAASKIGGQSGDQ